MDLMRVSCARHPPSSLGDEELELEEIREALKTFSEVLDGFAQRFLLKAFFIFSDGLTHVTYFGAELF